MRVRYYADAEIRNWHEQALRCLTAVQDQHDITVEIERIDEQHGQLSEFPGEVWSTMPEDVYERDLKRNQTLNKRIDETPSQAYKRHGTLKIAGNVAVVADEGSVEWASTLSGYADGYMPGVESETAMDFLEDIAADPNSRICTECCVQLDGSEQFCPGCGTDLS
jgi:hypothetical protein